MSLLSLYVTTVHLCVCVCVFLCVCVCVCVCVTVCVCHCLCHYYALTCAHGNTLQPGDRVQVIGVYRCLPFKKGGYTSGAFRTVVIANNVVLMSKEVSPHFSAKDVTQIKRFCKKRKYVSIHCIVLP